MTANKRWTWGKERFRSNDFKEKVSQTRKAMFANGTLKSPTIGLKRPDLAERNRKDAKFTEETVHALYKEYATHKGGLRGFARAKGCNSNYLRHLFWRFIAPDQLELVMEAKKGQCNKYAIGRCFEWRVRDHFKKNGYFVLRSPQSAGPVDLVAIKKGEVLFIQCKTHGYMSRIEKQKLCELAVSVGAKPLLIWRGLAPHYPLTVQNLLNLQTTRVFGVIMEALEK
jgi:Holliday junction resolvase